MNIPVVQRHLEVDWSFPVCPICSQPINRFDDIVIVDNLDMDVLALAHSICCEGQEGDDDE